MTQEVADAFAAEWMAAWNAHDLEAVLAHYAEDGVFTSPFVAGRAGGAAGTRLGKAAGGGHFGRALADGEVVAGGRRVDATGGPGVARPGGRFGALKPAACLHPTIPGHAPLTFDVVDQWKQRSLGGCTYHVRHPAGRI